MTGDLPPGFGAVDTPAARAFARPEMEGWVREALAREESLHRAASAAARRRLQGRLPVPVVEAGGRERVVRHYHRGGAVAPLLGDRYLRVGRPRPLRELAASEEARRRGLPTPRVVAGAVYPAGLVYRADLVTDYVPSSADLDGVVFEARPSAPADPETALRTAGSLVARMAAAGLRHPDVNVKNVLLSEGEEGPVAWILDLDRCTLTGDGGPVSPEPMVARLLRSLRKRAAARGRPVEPREMAALEAGLAAEGGPG